MAEGPVIGVLHPGAMGAAVGGALVATGHVVRWASEGRSEATAERARQAGLEDVGTVRALAEGCDVLLSICPPHAALAVARSVAPFVGTYVDANAVSPATAASIAGVIAEGGGRFVDGGIIGPPPTAAGTTRLFVAGEDAADVAKLFAGSLLDAPVLEGDVGAASALKLAYAAWTKGSSALLLAVAEAASALGIDDALRAEWERSQPGLADQLAQARRSADAKGWRWVAEMEEIAATFASTGQPTGFHLAAADVYRTFGTPPALDVVIGPLESADEAAAEALLDEAVAGRHQVRMGEQHDVLALPGFVARVDGEVAGVVTYTTGGPSSELAVLAVAEHHRGRGLGGRLVEEVARAAAEQGAASVWLVTTNDNLDALRLYQRHGFALSEVRKGVIEESRRTKPQIPLTGDYGIPLRDELVLVRHLDVPSKATAGS